MNITLTYMQRHCLAAQFAKALHANLIELHLRAVDLLDGKTPATPSFGSDIAEIRQAIASISDRRERRCFIVALRHLFHEIRRERGTEPTSRAYVAHVLAYRERRAA